MKRKASKKKAISILLCFMMIFAYSAGFGDILMVHAEENIVNDSNGKEDKNSSMAPSAAKDELSSENNSVFESSSADEENSKANVITSWKWVDDSEIFTYDKENQVWSVSPAADEENPITAELLEEYFPTSIAATLSDGTKIDVQITWDFSVIGDGVTAGEYTFAATLPEDYVLANDAAVLEALVKLDSPMLLAALLVV